MRVIDAAIGICWLVFWAGWLASALTVKRGRTRWGQWTFSRAGIVLVFLLLMRLRVFRHHVAVGGLWLPVIGLVIVLAGLAFAVWARVSIGRNWGIPMTEKADPELVTTGPYSRVRHPIYTGIFTAVIGTALAISPWYLIVAAVLGAYFTYSAINEERYLASRFPESYPAYKSATKMLLPYVF